MMRTVLKPGTLLRFPDGSEYRIERLMGLGGSALLYEARDLHSALYVALKELYPAEGFLRRNGQVVPEGDTPGGWAALNARKAHMREREAELSQRASRRSFQVVPILPPIYDTVDLTLPDGTFLPGVENCYARMDSLREKGMTLRDFVDEYIAVHGTLPLQVMTAIMETVLDAYSALHSDGYLHGDCQTGNIFLLGANVEEKRVGVAHIIDFGSARELIDGEKTAPVLDDIYSTDGYCAPELLHPEPGFVMTPACDVWSLGVVFLNLVTGTADRWAEDGLTGLTEYLMLHPREKVLRPRMGKKLGCSIAVLALVNHILARAMENDPKKRYLNAAHMASDLKTLDRCLSFRWQDGVDRWLLWEAALRYREKNPVLFRTEHVPQLVDSLPVKKLELLASLDGGKPYPVQDILRDLPEGKNLVAYKREPDLFGDDWEMEEILEELQEAIEKEYFRLSETEEKLLEMARKDQAEDTYKIAMNALFQDAKPPEQVEDTCKITEDAPSQDVKPPEPQELPELTADDKAWSLFDNMFKDHPVSVERDGVGKRLTLRRRKEPEPEPELWRGQGNLYLHAPGGAGKSFTVAEVLTRYLDSGEKLPLYLDLIHFRREEVSGSASPEQAIYRLLSRQYFGGDEAADSIAEALTGTTTSPGVCLVLDNLHKVQKDLTPAVNAAIQTIHKQGNTWLLVVGRAADPFSGEEAFPPHRLALKPLKLKMVEELVQQIWKDKAVPETLGGLQGFQKHRQEKMFPEDKRVLKAQYSTLGLPLFLMRYLEVFASMPDGLDLPKGSAELLSRYFAQREYDANGRDVHEFLTRHMPWVACQYKASGKSECSREEIEGWLKESYGRLRYRPEYLDAFLYQAVDNLAVLAPGGEGLRFVHDCYEEYFAASAISERLKQVVETGDIRLLEKINYTWEEEPEALWLTLCTLDASGGRVETICTTEDFEGELLALLNSDKETARQYACHIPMGVLRGHCSFWYPWSKLTEWLNPGKVFMAEDPRDGIELKRPEEHMKWQKHLPWMELGAKLGDPELQYWYGRLLWMTSVGKAGEADQQEEAVGWIRAAAEQGHGEAGYLLSWHYRHGLGVPRDEEQATQWIITAAEAGHMEAVVWAGSFYEVGMGVPKNAETSIHWYRIAAEAGHKEGQFRYGWACWDGFGREKNLRQAHYWFTKAAEGGREGHPEALFFLGDMYDYGDGVAEDKRLALNYYRQAARAGHPEAQYRTGLAYRKGVGVSEHKVLATTWFKRAAQQGHAGAQNAYANMLIDGEADYKKELFLEREPMEEALYYLGESHKQGNKAGTNNLGWMYLHGHGMTAPDYPRALELFREAADRGSAAAVKHLGEMYEQGLGVEPDLPRALWYYKKAKEMGARTVDAGIARLEAVVDDAAPNDP